MEVLIGFVGSLIKISILGSLYALIILWLFKRIGKTHQDGWFDMVSRKKRRLWFISGLILSLLLFCYLFTYWGFHGFGDESRIPIGNGVLVENMNWDEYGYIRDVNTCDNINIEMTKFIVEDDKLFGNLESGFYDFKNSYFIYELDEKLLLEFGSIKDYENYALINNFPLPDEFKSYRENYMEYWFTWRFWLLP